MWRDMKRIIPVPVSCFSSSGKISSLAAAECPAFFPADVILLQDTVHLCYSTEGYRPLSRCRELKAEQVFAVVKAVICQVETARDWMWFPDEYVISEDTVWMNSKGQVRMLFVPDDKPVPYSRRLQCFFHGLKRLSEPAVSFYLQTLQELIRSEPVRAEQLLSEIDQMHAEVQSYF